MANSYFDEIPECPLCLEPLGWDDINFYPCACRYQICRFCWHRIRTDENGLCPHCREVYPENPAEYTPPTQEQLAKTKSEKKQKELCKRQKVVESRERLGAVRVVQRNLVFVIGLSPRLADPEVLKKNEYFGKYGKIYKVVINNHTIYSGAQGPSVSAYVTYCRSEDASKAIAAVNNAFIDGRSLKASFGTTKYCTSFLKGTLCTKPDCMYLHELGEDEASFTKEDMQLGKHQVFESTTLASLLPVGTGGKENSPLITAEGGVKIKHTVVQRSKEALQQDLAESALPASAHWASNQKLQGESLLDQTHSNAKPSPDSGVHSPSNKQPKATAKSHSYSSSRGTGTEHGVNFRSSSRRKETQRYNVGEDGLRPGSISPNTQKSLDAMKRVPSLGLTLGKADVRNSHSRGSTKSATPNLSPSSSSLSASLSSGSLGQEAEEMSVSPGAEDGEGGSRLLSQDSGESDVSSGGVSDSQGTMEQEGAHKTTNGHELKIQVPVSCPKPDIGGVGEDRDGCVAPPTSCLPTAAGDVNFEGSSSPMSSPPGLSKNRAQPLPLSTQSELVCRKLDLGTKPPLLLAGQNMAGSIGSPPPQLVSREGVRSSEQMGHIGNGEGTGLISRGGVRSSEQLRQVVSEGGTRLDSNGGVWSSDQLRQLGEGGTRLDSNGGVWSSEQMQGGSGRETGLDSRGSVWSSEQFAHEGTQAGLVSVRSSEQFRQVGSIEGATGRGARSSEQFRQVGSVEGATCRGARSSEQFRQVGGVEGATGRGARSSEQLGHVGGEGGSDRRMVGTGPASISNGVISSLTSAHFGALGINWSHPGLNQPLPAAPAFPPNSHSYTITPATGHPASVQPTHLPHQPSAGSRHSDPSHLLPTTSAADQSRQKVDDGDDLGFDPWDVSQQGLADLLETEAEQTKPHPLEPAHKHPNPTAHKKRVPNGMTSSAFSGRESETLYKNWHAPKTTAGNADAGGMGRARSDSDDDCLQDEFRALFPSVNISFGGPTSKSTSEKPSPLVQALDASNPTNSIGSYLPTHLATALNYSYYAPHHLKPSATSLGHAHLPAKQGVGAPEGGVPSATSLGHAHLPAKQGVGAPEGGVPPATTSLGHAHLTANKKGAGPPLEGGVAPIGMPNLFLGQSQPGFPASCFRVKGHDSVATTTTATPASTAAVGGMVSNTASYTSCLGTDWPDLGVTLGQGSKAQGKTVGAAPAQGGEGGTGSHGVEASQGDGSSTMWKAASENSTSVTVSSSSSSPAIPPPPPGFSKAHVETTPTSTTAGIGTGNGNQTTTTAASVNPMLLANSKGQFLPNHLLQSWSNLRNLAKLTPAQQQQLARTNQLTFQQQQLLAHQYLFQQALMRNPALQAQSLRMAQQFQRAALLQQQQQQQALIAGLKAAGTAPSSTVNPTCTAQNAGSVSMATGMTSAPTTSVSASASQSASKAAAGGDPSVPSKLGSKAPHPNATNSGLKGHSTSGRSSGQNSARGFSSGHSKNSSQVTSSNSSGQSNPPVVLTSRSSGDNKHHHPRNSKSAKPKSGGGVHHPAITVLDRKTRQKLSK